ncbi:hypothetical protein [Actinoplanes flavus]|uniref:Uncharacterized protein n=1 Tax=Actinoplanes flavus TaxID=2820290 RepID=A0ABS3UZZ4_9ACTN|nr:hypothetical protein [Actinoplanes flavus]MBO3744157.1 hypothetical protein [Actinoplanes flavus]
MPLAVGTAQIARDRLLAAQAQPVALRWAQTGHWRITAVDARNGEIIVSAVGLPPEPAPSALREALDAAGMSDAGLRVRLVGGYTKVCRARQATCESAFG